MKIVPKPGGSLLYTLAPVTGRRGGQEATQAQVPPRDTNTPARTVSNSLLKLPACNGDRFWHSVPESVPHARYPEEPGAVIPHAGICEGGHRVTGVPTSIGRISKDAAAPMLLLFIFVKYKDMKKLLLLSGAILLFLTSCTKKPNGSFTNTANLLGTEVRCTYDFRSDGRFFHNTGGPNSSGTWVTRGGAIVATFDNGETKEFKWEGSDLVLTKSGEDVIEIPSRFIKQ